MTDIPQEDLAAVTALPQRLIEAWSKADAAAFGDLFVEDGTMIMPGRYFQGRAAIEEFMAQAFAGPYKGTQVTGTPLELKVLDANAIVLVSLGGVIAAGEDELSEAAKIRASWVTTKRDGQWRLAVYQNSPVQAA
ncbi:SgcJ/EcaC family oxidoreductase [Dactylosporangium sp. CS-047395]|uniref:SgcJ/EcaC family oxidoreductase n=1 Tax=Dactylosporangium sp. CS-047395 TaxID=3239936 RepID=UPI003D92C7EF